MLKGFDISNVEEAENNNKRISVTKGQSQDGARLQGPSKKDISS